MTTAAGAFSRRADPSRLFRWKDRYSAAIEALTAIATESRTGSGA